MSVRRRRWRRPGYQRRHGSPSADRSSSSGTAAGIFGRRGVFVRVGAGLGGAARGGFKQCGHGDLGRVERVVEEPPPALVAGVAALATARYPPAAGPGLDGQVDAAAQHLAAVFRPVAAHVFAVGDLLAQALERDALVGAQQVDERHGVLSGTGMARTRAGLEAGRQARGVAGAGSVTGGVRAGGQQGKGVALAADLASIRPRPICPIVVLRRRPLVVSCPCPATSGRSPATVSRRCRDAAGIPRSHRALGRVPPCQFGAFQPEAGRWSAASGDRRLAYFTRPPDQAGANRKRYVMTRRVLAVVLSGCGAAVGFPARRLRCSERSRRRRYSGDDSCGSARTTSPDRPGQTTWARHASR